MTLAWTIKDHRGDLNMGTIRATEDDAMGDWLVLNGLHHHEMHHKEYMRETFQRFARLYRLKVVRVAVIEE